MDVLQLDLLTGMDTAQIRAFWLGLIFGLSLELALFCGTAAIRALFLASSQSGSSKS